MREDAIFRLASLTKPIVATTALAMVDAGLLGLDDNVTDHLPYFQPQWDGKPATIKVRHLLTHTSGLSYDPALLAGGRRHRRDERARSCRSRRTSAASGR